MTTKTTNALRWTAMVPGAYLTGFICYWITILFFNYIPLWYKQEIMKFVPLLAAGIAGYAFIEGGVNIAPNSKEKAASILLIIAIVMQVCLAWVSYDYQNWMLMVSAIINMGGALACFYQVKYNLEKQRIIGY